MRRIQIDPKGKRHRDDRASVPPLDARDPDILRAKRASETIFRYRPRP